MYFQAVLSQEKLPSLDGVLIGGKSLQYSKAVFSFQQFDLLVKRFSHSLKYN